MISVKQNSNHDFAISVDEHFVSINDFGKIVIVLKKQNTDKEINIPSRIMSFDCTRKVLFLNSNFDDTLSGEYKIIVTNNKNIIYRGMIIVEAPDKVSGFNGVIIG